MSVLPPLLRVVERGLHRAGEAVDDAARLTRFTRGRLEFEPRATDVFVATYPRSGTTWLLYLLHRLRSGGAPFEHIDDVCPWYERGLAVGSWDAAAFDRLASPRIFKTHLLPRWLPAVGRVVYIERDPLEVAASYYALYRDYLRFTGSLSAFVDRFVVGDVQYGAWQSHVGEWRNSGRASAWVRYEALRGDTAGALRSVAERVGLPRDDIAVEEACTAASRERMRAQHSRFDHVTALLRERGVVAGSFIGDATDRARPDPSLRLRLAQSRPRARLRAFLR